MSLPVHSGEATTGFGGAVSVTAVTEGAGKGAAVRCSTEAPPHDTTKSRIPIRMHGR